MSPAWIKDLVANDPWMMRVLSAAEEMNLPDWWLGAGFLRNTVWDALAGNPVTHTGDVDLVYFDQSACEPETDWRIEQQMRDQYPWALWEVRNQARMHTVDGFEAYSSTADGIAHWVETATCVGVRLRCCELQFLFCYGTEDLVDMVARPITEFRSPERIDTFHRRVAEKRWKERWPSLCIMIDGR